MIAREGYIILIIAALLLMFSCLWHWISPGKISLFSTSLLAVFTLFSFYFFRDPQRTIPAGDNLMVAPGDGRIMEILTIEDPRLGQVNRISIFLSVFNVHRQRIPIAAQVTHIERQDGKYLAAFKSGASTENAYVRTDLESAYGSVAVKQIVGWIARRIVCDLTPGSSVQKGENLGFIRFGSRVDLYVPLVCILTIQPGDVVRGGETIIGRFE